MIQLKTKFTELIGAQLFFYLALWCFLEWSFGRKLGNSGSYTKVFRFNVGKKVGCIFGKVIGLCGCSLDERNLASVDACLCAEA